MILLIDNYDSFTYNIFHYLVSEGAEVRVCRNDRITTEELAALDPQAIVISPGPGIPAEAGISEAVIRDFHQTVPILGICLGHQAIASAFGASIIRAGSIRHGKASMITHDGNGLFDYMPQPLEVMRYHSLAVDRTTLPTQLKITATSMDDKEIMAIKHRKYPVYGIQFHPESIGTLNGKEMIRNFLKKIGEENYVETIS
ncbi:anthranilate synthase component II [Virgibacillus kekensis]|uniref:Anthranilate synthase component II n=1 Tax=Virgibacillus kekensis TaxID=202261 RepID=A0ABV9DKX8_9BACI